jgi:uncharacterized protein YkwD
MRYMLSLFLTGMLMTNLALSVRAEDPIISTQTEVVPPVPTPKSVTILFPVLYDVRWSDTFGAPRDGGKRKHQGQDLMAPKLSPLIAVFEGRVYLGPGGPGGHYSISVTNEEGWTANYYHVNNDSPGTDDGNGGNDYAFAPGLKSGDNVKAGQLLGWVGDSGNAENTGPHCHFELWYRGQCINAAASLRAARRLDAPLLTTAAPGLKPNKGELRLDGVVRSVEGDLLVLDLMATTAFKGKMTAIRKPERRYVLLKGAKLHRRDDPTQTLTVGDLQPGVPVTVLGKDRGKGKALLARLTAPEIPSVPATLVAEATQPNTTLPDGRDTPSNGTDPAVEPEPAETVAEPKPETRTPEAVASKPARRGSVAAPDADMLDVVKRINELRKQNGLSELTFDAKLSRAAERHSKDMAVGGFCEHAGSDGTRVSDRVEDAGYSAARVAQNIASGFETSEKVVNAWTRNRDTERNLLDSAFKEIGVGWYRASRGGPRCWTLVLATP